MSDFCNLRRLVLMQEGLISSLISKSQVAVLKLQNKSVLQTDAIILSLVEPMLFIENE